MRSIAEWDTSTAEGHLAAYGGYHDGAWYAGASHLAVDGGVSVPPGSYVLAKPLRYEGRRVWAESPGSVTYTPPPDVSTWSAMAGAVGGDGVLSGVRIDADHRVPVGVLLERWHLSSGAPGEVYGATDVGYLLDRCQSTGNVASLYAHHCTNGIRAIGCNALHGSAWRVLNCPDGTALQIRGGGLSGGCSIDGLTLEVCKIGLDVAEVTAPVHLGGYTHIESASDYGMRVADGARVSAASVYITGANGSTAVILRRNAHLDVQRLILGGNDMVIDVGEGCTISGEVRPAHPGHSVRMLYR